MNRLTVARPATMNGIGLHTGHDLSMTVSHAACGTGRVWRRVDLDALDVPALVPYVSNTAHRTELSRGAASVTTVEHFLAAAYAFGIEDVRIDVTGPEVPIGDGSAIGCVEMLTQAGCTEGSDAIEPLVVSTPFELREAQSVYEVTPATRLRLSVRIDLPHPLIGTQSIDIDVDQHTFVSEIAPARTFGYLDDHERLKHIGLACGADASNVLGLTREGLANGPLHWPDEFVRHKALDLLGDLALVGRPICAHITATQPGHAGNVALARALFATATKTIEA